jgi:hypothetical protein
MAYQDAPETTTEFRPTVGQTNVGIGAVSSVSKAEAPSSAKILEVSSSVRE